MQCAERDHAQVHSEVEYLKDFAFGEHKHQNAAISQRNARENLENQGVSLWIFFLFFKSFEILNLKGFEIQSLPMRPSSPDTPGLAVVSLAERSVCTASAGDLQTLR